jgi:hypothetical protein
MYAYIRLTHILTLTLYYIKLILLPYLLTFVIYNPLLDHTADIQLDYIYKQGTHVLLKCVA